jgi:hypothetical protein
MQSCRRPRPLSRRPPLSVARFVKDRHTAVKDTTADGRRIRSPLPDPYPIHTTRLLFVIARSEALIKQRKQSGAGLGVLRSGLIHPRLAERDRNDESKCRASEEPPRRRKNRVNTVAPIRGRTLCWCPRLLANTRRRPCPRGLARRETCSGAPKRGCNGSAQGLENPPCPAWAGHRAVGPQVLPAPP